MKPPARNGPRFPGPAPPRCKKLATCKKGPRLLSNRGCEPGPPASNLPDCFTLNSLSPPRPGSPPPTVPSLSPRPQKQVRVAVYSPVPPETPGATAGEFKTPKRRKKNWPDGRARWEEITPQGFPRSPKAFFPGRNCGPQSQEWGTPPGPQAPTAPQLPESSCKKKEQTVFVLVTIEEADPWEEAGLGQTPSGEKKTPPWGGGNGGAPKRGKQPRITKAERVRPIFPSFPGLLRRPGNGCKPGTRKIGHPPPPGPYDGVSWGGNTPVFPAASHPPAREALSSAATKRPSKRVPPRNASPRQLTGERPITPHLPCVGPQLNDPLTASPLPPEEASAPAVPQAEAPLVFSG